MNIEVYCLANNEERLMPYIMRHYTQFAKVILIESCSTDNTVKICKDLGGAVWSYDLPDEINDQWYTDVKNTCWQKSKADWIMVVDADEFIYCPNIVSVLENTKSTIFLPLFYNMYSDVFPTTDGQIYEEVRLGNLWGGEQHIYGKANIFKLPEIKKINYNVGCHQIKPVGDVRLEITDDIKTLHMRNLSKEFVIERNARNSKRLSSLNRKNGWGLYVDMSPEEAGKRFDEEMNHATIVI
jgi:glycosyltransferase involved in cell wall biosynthesis